jgi:hypothetical protein
MWLTNISPALDRSFEGSTHQRLFPLTSQRTCLTSRSLTSVSQVRDFYFLNDNVNCKPTSLIHILKGKTLRSFDDTGLLTESTRSDCPEILIPWLPSLQGCVCSQGPLRGHHPITKTVFHYIHTLGLEQPLIYRNYTQMTFRGRKVPYFWRKSLRRQSLLKVV